MSKSPWFPAYAQDFISGSVRLMELDEVGAYWLLLCHQWITGAIPMDRQGQARVCGCAVEVMDRIWPALADKFPGGRNPRMEEERRRSEALVERGKKAARARWKGHHKRNA